MGYEKNRFDRSVVVGSTGPTARFIKSSNKIIHNLKQISFKYKNKLTQSLQ